MSKSADLDELALSYELMEAMTTPDSTTLYKPPITPNYELIEALREAMETPDSTPDVLHINHTKKEAFALLDYINLKLIVQLAKAMQEENTSPRR